MSGHRCERAPKDGESFFIRTTSVKSSDDDDMCVTGQYHMAVHIHKKLIQRFNYDPAHANQLAVTYLMINRFVSLLWC
jgi:hypothetical protein